MDIFDKVRWWVVLLGVGTAGVGSGGVSDGVAAPFATPVAVEPAACLVEPRPVSEIVALVGTAVPGQTPLPVPIASPAPMPTQDAQPADAATAEAVAATLVEVAACSEAREFARAYALQTDDHLRRTVGPLTEEHLALLEGVEFPNASERSFTVLTVNDVRLLSDGRAIAVAVVEAEGEEPRELGFVLRPEGDRWLLDGTVAVPGPGTPTS